MMTAAGYEVYDLGISRSCCIYEKAEEVGAILLL